MHPNWARQHLAHALFENEIDFFDFSPNPIALHPWTSNIAVVEGEAEASVVDREGEERFVVIPTRDFKL
jgi:hypothetical protein